jgi:hypothetical protein
MKVQSVQLKHFKKFLSSPEFDFTDPETGLAKDMIILVGMNIRSTSETDVLRLRRRIRITGMNCVDFC